MCLKSPSGGVKERMKKGWIKNTNMPCPSNYSL